jgi:hypothetical protein
VNPSSPAQNFATPGQATPLIRDTKQRHNPTPASGWSISAAALKFAARAAFAQGMAFVIQGAIRNAFQETYHETRGPDEHLTDLGMLAAATVGTFIFDQTCIHKAVSSVYEWVATKLNGGDVPAPPLSGTGRHLVSLLPTAMSVALVVREAHGDNADEPMLLAYDLAGMMLGWRLGRLVRDTIQQGTTGSMPKLKIVDMDTGEELTGQQKKTFDDTRLGWQMTMYTATIFINAFVTVPEGLRPILGPAINERSLDRLTRLCAMAAPAIGSMGVEAADEAYSILAQVVVAPRQGAVLEISHDAKTPADWGDLAVRHGAMRALMGTLVTDLAQLFMSVDRGMDQWSALGTAIGSVAASIMDIRAKSVGVTKKYRTAAREFQLIVNQLARAAEKLHFATCAKCFTPDESKRMKAEIRKVAHAFSKAGWGSMTVERVKAMSRKELAVAMLAMRHKEAFEGLARERGINLKSSRDEKARISGLMQHTNDTPLDQQPILALLDRRRPFAENKQQPPKGSEQQRPADNNNSVRPTDRQLFRTVGREVAETENVRVNPQGSPSKSGANPSAVSNPLQIQSQAQSPKKLERVASQRPESLDRPEPEAGMSVAKPQLELVLANGLVLEKAQIVNKDPESQEWTVRVPSGQDTGNLQVTMVGSDGFKVVKVPKDMQSSLSQ